ncbi:Flp pilus assembly protein CpaB [Paenibacillus sedimenti]|uniref:Flp pilus assembly protein CpaB n=1 Tax=Paenibacillus sedimenti TaxID=2770274 RepID=A0A926KUA8_9BACL|nr:Flp pilus assembly protein CpaB [Paenibacillus sedimenti]MBD0382373.1 Flp pilus assembly protein CpaB [Paenibacillus sedimenti]
MRSKIILFAALIMGLITTFLFFNYMKQYDQATTVNENMVDVVVAKQQIKRNQKLQADMLEIKQVPLLGVHPQAIKSIQGADGKFADATIETGEVLLSHRVKTSKDESAIVAKKVQNGFRAVSVGINLVQSVSNLIEPDDYVDVIVTIPPKEGNDKQIEASTMLLEKIRVLAVGRRMVEVDDQHPYAEYTSVTLEVKPEDVPKIINADDRFNVSLALHSRVVPEAAKK